MKRQYMYLAKYDWSVVIYYDTDRRARKLVGEQLRSMGASEKQIRHAEELLGGVDCGRNTPHTLNESIPEA